MSIFQRLVLRCAAVAIIATACICLGAQTGESANEAGSISTSIALDSDRFPVGQGPLVILTIDNLTDRDLYLHGNWFQLHIEGESGEARTKLRQRMSTGKLLPGEAPLREDENVEKVISSGKSRIEKIDLMYFYDLSVPGKYSVYVDIKDPLSGKFKRTATVRFEILSVPPQNQ